MAALWMVVLSVFVLVVHSTEAEVTTKDLTELVKELYKYAPTHRGESTWPMFSVAVSVPKDQNTNKYDFNRVFGVDSKDNVKDAMTSCKVYAGTRVVAATVLQYPETICRCPYKTVEWEQVKKDCPDVKIWADFTVKEKCSDEKMQNLLNTEHKLVDHVEWRVLSNFPTAFKERTVNKKDDLMLFYVRANPCGGRCLKSGGTLNILDKISDVTTWTNRAFVFTYLFKPPEYKGKIDILKQETRDALLELGGKIGLKNIYRCRENSNCFSCSSDGTDKKFNEDCVDPR